MSQLLSQTRDLQNKANSLSEEKPSHTRNSTGIPGDIFEGLLAREGQPSAILENSRNLSSRRIRPESTGVTMTPEREMKRELQNSSSIHVACFHRGDGVFDHTGGTYSHNGVVDYPRFPISEMHLGKFSDSMEFQSWKVNFKTEECSRTADPHLTMQWIKEVEIAKSIDEIMTSRSFVGRTDFPDYDMLDAMIASALKNASRQACTLPTNSKCR